MKVCLVKNKVCKYNWGVIALNTYDRSFPRMFVEGWKPGKQEPIAVDSGGLAHFSCTEYTHQ
jgi:hypothetical protein